MFPTDPLEEVINLVPPPIIQPPDKGVKVKGGRIRPSQTQNKDIVPIEELKKEVNLVKKYNKELASFRRQKVEQAEYKVLKKLPNIIEKIILQAESGCTTSQKMLLDRILPVVKSEDKASIQVGKGNVINITVTNSQDEPISNEPIIEAEYEETE